MATASSIIIVHEHSNAQHGIGVGLLFDPPLSWLRPTQMFVAHRYTVWTVTRTGYDFYVHLQNIVL